MSQAIKTVYWQVRDGYAGGSRPQKTIIYDWQIEDCEGGDEIEERIHEIVQDDFDQKVMFEITGIEELDV